MNGLTRHHMLISPRCDRGERDEHMVWAAGNLNAGNRPECSRPTSLESRRRQPRDPRRSEAS